MSKIVLKSPVEHLPSVTLLTTTKSALAAAIPHDRIWQGVRLLDGKYWYVSHEDWGKVFADVLQNMPRYTTDRFDCEDFAFLTKCRVTERFRINAFVIVTGLAPFGEHAWNWFYDELGWHQFEPQSGEVGDIDSDGYISKWILG